jgi:PhnB protein
MSVINSYLTFNGNCREAMTFYKKCLGGKLTLQKVGESPLADKMPQQMKKSILQATLANGDLLLMASDMVSEKGLIKGNAVSMMLACASEKELRESYKKLSAGGQATHPPDTNFEGVLFGTLTDKFGNHWLLHFDKNKKKNSFKLRSK